MQDSGLNYALIDNHKDGWVVMLHGMGGSTAMWKYQVDALSAHFNLVNFDLHGHGASERTLGDLPEITLENVSREIVQVLDQLGIRQFALMGVSLGTAVARAIMVHYPQRVTCAVMAGAFTGYTMFTRCFSAVLSCLDNRVDARKLYNLLAYVLLPFKQHRKSREMYVQESLKMKPGEFFRWIRLLQDFDRLYPPREVMQTEIPTLFVSGAQDYTFLGGVRKYVKPSQTTRLAILPDCGHIVTMEAKQVFNEMACSFLCEFGQPAPEWALVVNL